MIMKLKNKQKISDTHLVRVDFIGIFLADVLRNGDCQEDFE